MKKPQQIPENLRHLIEQSFLEDQRRIEDEFSAILQGLVDSRVINASQKQEIHDRISDDIYTGLMLRLVKSLNEDDKKHLHNLYQSGLNDYQQLQVILKLYEKRAGEPWEHTMLTLYDQALKQFIYEYYVLKDTLRDASKLTDEECDRVDSLIEDGKWDEALEEFDRLSHASEQPKPPIAQPRFDSTTDSEKDPSQPQQLQTPRAGFDPRVEEIVRLLREGKFDDAKQRLGEL